MNNNYNILLKKFKEIANKGWIKGINSTTNSVGLTFENEIGKTADSLFFPDYYGIEIKCTQRFSRYPITLFTSSFDGPSLYEMNRLLEKYGKNDIIYHNKKLLLTEIKTQNIILFNNKYYFKLNISKVDQKMYIEIYDINKNLIENKTYISFDTIKNKLELKLSNLALVFASKKCFNNYPYFRYYKIIFYKLISFEKFIELIEKNIIIVELVGRISRSGIEAGRQRNKNLVFKINKENIDKLFITKNYYDNDMKKSVI